MGDPELREVRYQLETALRALNIAIWKPTTNDDFTVNIAAKVLDALKACEAAQYAAWQPRDSGFVLPGYYCIDPISQV